MQQDFECGKNTGFKEGIQDIILTVAIVVCFHFLKMFWYEIAEFSTEAYQTNNRIDALSAIDAVEWLNWGLWILMAIGIFTVVKSIIAVVRFVQAIVYKCELPKVSFAMGLVCLGALIPCLVGTVELMIAIYPLVD